MPYNHIFLFFYFPFGCVEISRQKEIHFQLERTGNVTLLHSSGQIRDRTVGSMSSPPFSSGPVQMGKWVELTKRRSEDETLHVQKLLSSFHSLHHLLCTWSEKCTLK